jgi:hypothetical protein
LPQVAAAVAALAAVAAAAVVVVSAAVVVAAVVGPGNGDGDNEARYEGLRWAGWPAGAPPPPDCPRAGVVRR